MATTTRENRAFCHQAPPIWASFVNVLQDHAFSDIVLGPRKNPCQTFFSTAARGDVWSDPASVEVHNKHAGPTKLPAPARLVALGDLHGDYEKTKEILRLANLLGRKYNWSGGRSMLVQVGDVMDRGGGELKILYLLENLRRQAVRAGGSVHVLHGNHEISNSTGRFTYAHKEGFEEFYDWWLWYKIASTLKGSVAGCRKNIDYSLGLPNLTAMPGMKGVDTRSPLYLGMVARMAAMRPGGPVSKRFLGNNPTVLLVGNSMFVHGGIKPGQVEGGLKTLEHYNKSVRKWIRGHKGSNPPSIVRQHMGGDPVTWQRDYATESGKNVPCNMIRATLGAVGCTRMLIGHTIQRERLINAACRGAIIRIDVGFSKGCVNNPVQALEIVNDKELNVISARGRNPLRIEEEANISPTSSMKDAELVDVESDPHYADSASSSSSEPEGRPPKPASSSEVKGRPPRPAPSSESEGRPPWPASLMSLPSSSESESGSQPSKPPKEKLSPLDMFAKLKEKKLWKTKKRDEPKDE